MSSDVDETAEGAVDEVDDLEVGESDVAGGAGEYGVASVFNAAAPSGTSSPARKGGLPG